MNKKIILITGGAGFIGAHLCRHLLNKGNKIICVDAFFSGQKENIKDLLKNKDFILIKHNIIYPIKKKFKKIDEIYNLACPASPLQYQFDPILTLKTNVIGTMNMLELARKYNSRFLQTSTSEIYGNPLEHPQKEEYFGNVDTLGKRSCYDEGKRAAETLCKDYKEQYGVDTRIVRLFNVYGPGMMFNDGRVVSNFIVQALLNKDITIHGFGEQSRSFMYIDDLINALPLVMNLEENKIGIKAINLGNPDERSIKILAEDIKSVTNSNSNIIYINYENISNRLGDPQKRCPDINRAKELLSWYPKINFNEGLRKTVDNFSKRLKDKTKIIVFSPTYYPLEGPVELALKEITNNLISYDFDLIVAKMKKGLKKEEKIGRINVYRVGFGNRLDKYFLPILAPLKALFLNKKNNYQIVWGIMSSYGSLAGIIFSFLVNKAFLLSYYEGNKKKSVRYRFFRPISKLIFKKSNNLQIVEKLSNQELAWLENNKNIQFIDLNKNWNYISRKTKENFQELEILSSRL